MDEIQSKEDALREIVRVRDDLHELALSQVVGTVEMLIELGVLCYKMWVL